MQKKKKQDSKSRLWTVITVLNILGFAFPLGYYLQSDGGNQIFAAVLLVCAVFFLIILDGLTALFANFNVNEL